MMLFRNVFTLSFWTNFSLICAILPCPIVWSINDYYYYYIYTESNANFKYKDTVLSVCT